MQLEAAQAVSFQTKISKKNEKTPKRKHTKTNPK
jgi:hypothetical protein